MRTTALLGIVLVCALIRPVGAQERPSASAPAAKVLASFEDGLGGWEGTGGANVGVSADHTTDGARCLKVDLPAGEYPGVAIELKSEDWSAFDAVRLSVYNDSGKPIILSHRVDDAASKDFATRFNAELPLKLNPGANDVEFTLAELRQGNLFSRGLDLTRISSLRCFCPGLKEPATLYIDNVRLIRNDRPAVAVLNDFDANTTIRYVAQSATARIEDAPGVDDHKALRLEFAEGNYPGAVFTLAGALGDFLGYDLLTLNVICPPEGTIPHGINIKLTDAAGRKVTYATAVAKGSNTLSVPLEIAGQISLGKVRELTIFFDAGAGQVAYLDNIALRKLDRADFPSVHSDDARPGLKLDYTALKDLGKNSVWMAMVLIPLDSGKVRLVRCNSQVKGLTGYTIPADAFAGCPKGAVVRIWPYLIEHGVWHFYETVLTFDGNPLTLSVDDAKKMNH